MRRRRLALVLACLLGALAMLLGAGVAFLELSARDYVLAWRLRKTTRIEWSDPGAASRVIEVTDPAEVRKIVSLMTAKLDRLPQGGLWHTPYQLRFFLDDGRVIVAALPRYDRDPRKAFMRTAPGEPLRAYAADDYGLYAALRPSDDRPIELGTVHFDGVDTEVHFDFRHHAETSWPRMCEVFLSGPGTQALLAGQIRYTSKLRPLEADKDYDPGVLANAWAKTFSPVTFELDELDAVELTLNGHTETLKIPPLRFHEPIRPPCPSCGSEDVVPCVDTFPPNLPPPFKGRCKLSGVPGAGNPKYFCEECKQGF